MEATEKRLTRAEKLEAIMKSLAENDRQKALSGYWLVKRTWITFGEEIASVKSVYLPNGRTAGAGVKITTYNHGSSAVEGVRVRL